MKLANPMMGTPRKVLYYAGIGLAAFGMLLMLLAVAGAVVRGGAAPRLVPLAARAVSGVGLTALGFATMALGSRGVPGSAIDMDTEFQSDARSPRFNAELDETDDPLALAAVRDSDVRRPGDVPVTQAPAGLDELTCHWCRAVNDNQARYCDQCGMRF